MTLFQTKKSDAEAECERLERYDNLILIKDHTKNNKKNIIEMPKILLSTLDELKMIWQENLRKLTAEKDCKDEIPSHGHVGLENPKNSNFLYLKYYFDPDLLDNDFNFNFVNYHMLEKKRKARIKRQLINPHDDSIEMSQMQTVLESLVFS